ncbi:MAG: hypothetical protein IKN95_07675 [Lachnospiraceae bacterium]|nr:hypothetical protein [Lachnospiraceae bacterium]
MEIDTDYLKWRIWFIIASLVLVGVVIFLGFDRIFSGWGFVFFAVVVGMVLTSLGFIISFFVMINTGKDRTEAVLPITSISVAVITALIGIPLYIKGRREILGELAPLLLWVFVSVPAVVTALIHLVIFKIKMRRVDK